MKKYHMNKMDTSSRTLAPRRRRVGGWGKQRQLGMNETDKSSDFSTASVWNNLKRRHTGWKGLTWRSRWSRRISTPIEIWEHRLGKVWNQHLTSKQLEYQNQNKTKDRYVYEEDYVATYLSEQRIERMNYASTSTCREATGENKI